jgi:RNA polymerase sigma factor (sigma-70 family)
MVPPPTASEFGAILVAARQQDAAAIERLVEWCYPRVERIARERLRLDLQVSRPWLAARFSTGDVVQEVFRSVLTDLRGFLGSDERSFVGFLAVIVRNRIVDAVRFHEATTRDARRSRALFGAEAHLASDRGPMGEVMTAEELGRFAAVLASLPVRDQLLVRARLEDDHSFPELAALLDYPSAFAARRAFYSAQARILVRLRQS